MANKVLKTKIQLRNDTAANWTTNESVKLLKGEIGIELDTRKFKIGDGTSTWKDLEYANITDLSNYYTKEEIDNTFKKYWTEDQTKAYILTEFNTKLSSVFRYRGSLNSIDDLPTSDMVTGDVYNIISGFTTDDRFTEGAGIKYGAGTNVVYGQNSKWDVLAGLVDLSNYYTKTEIDNKLSSGLDDYYDKDYIDENYFNKTQTQSYVKTEINSATAGTYKYKGTKASITALPTSGNLTGDVWNITESFVTDDTDSRKFLEGAGHRYPAGTNVVFTNGITWDVLGSDLTDYLNTEEDTVTINCGNAAGSYE